MQKKKENNCIYLDHHATTPLDERVFAKIKPFFLWQFGNPASVNHPFGWQAQDAVDEARTQVAQAINAHPTEIIFTSGATESTNMALKGFFFTNKNEEKRRIVTSSIEHGATLATVNAICPSLAKLDIVKPESSGILSEETVVNAINKDTVMVSFFLVHNEIGSINPIKKIAKAIKKYNVLIHCDAAQALGRIKVDCKDLDVDMISFSGHKVYGPKGVGCLFIRKQLIDKIIPLIHGGGQEWFKRSGTLNVPGIVGFGEAARLAICEFVEENKRIKDLRDRLLNNLRVLDGVFVNGSLEKRVSGNLNVSFANIDGEELVLALCQQIAISTGSACSSSAGKKSLVLEEIGVPKELRQASIRFGIGRYTSVEEIDIASELIVNQVRYQRTKSSSKKKLIKLSRSK
jgi:cysteine desulfurase